MNIDELHGEIAWGFSHLFAATLKPSGNGFRALPSAPEILLVDHTAAPTVAAARQWVRDTWGADLPPGATGSFDAIGQVFCNVWLAGIGSILDASLVTNTVETVNQLGSDAERNALREVEAAVAHLPTARTVKALAICGRWEGDEAFGDGIEVKLKFETHQVRMRMVCMFPYAYDVVRDGPLDLAAVAAAVLREQGAVIVERARQGARRD